MMQLARCVPLQLRLPIGQRPSVHALTLLTELIGIICAVVLDIGHERSLTVSATQRRVAIFILATDLSVMGFSPLMVPRVRSKCTTRRMLVVGRKFITTIAILTMWAIGVSVSMKLGASWACLRRLQTSVRNACVVVVLMLTLFERLVLLLLST